MRTKETILILLIIAAVVVSLVMYNSENDPIAPGGQQNGEVPNDSVNPADDNAYNEYPDLIRIDYPKPGDKISSTSPLVVRGAARGTWYFEASFPLVIVNWDGLIIGESHAEAKSDWMTTEFVPFEGTIDFTKPDYGTRGAVIFKNDNPSGDPSRDKAVEIPIEFE